MDFGNVTIDPLSKARPVEEPAIEEIINLQSGAEFKAVEFIASYRYDDLVSLRVAIQEDLHAKRYRFACAWCSTPTYIVASQQKRFFFRHIEEDGSCAAQTRGMPRDEILARKYHGQRESEEHKRIKRLIERSLGADSSFSTIFLEKTWRSARDPKARRQPDVQAVRGDLRIAFEAQLSTTFLSVVAGRRQFYRDEGGLLVWVMAHFTPEYRRMTTDDLLFSNNSNILVVDDVSTAISEQEGVFHVRCFFRKPISSDDQISDTWEERIVRFDSLTLELDRQRAYFFDFDSEEKKIEQKIKAEQVTESERNDELLRQAFLMFWDSPERYSDFVKSEADWALLRNKFEERGISVPFGHYDLWNLRAVLYAVLSAKAGSPVGWQYTSIVQVAHLLEDKHKDVLLVFGYALEAYGHRNKLEDEDKTGRWKTKQSRIRQQIASYDPEFLPDVEWIGLVGFLFPEIGEKIQAYVSRAQKHNAKVLEDI